MSCSWFVDDAFWVGFCCYRQSYSFSFFCLKAGYISIMQDFLNWSSCTALCKSFVFFLLIFNQSFRLCLKNKCFWLVFHTRFCTWSDKQPILNWIVRLFVTEVMKKHKISSLHQQYDSKRAMSRKLGRSERSMKCVLKIIWGNWISGVQRTSGRRGWTVSEMKSGLSVDLSTVC